MAHATGKAYFYLHAEIDDDGKLNLVDESGRVLAGVKEKRVYTSADDLSTADVKLVLGYSSNESPCYGLSRGKVK